MDRNSRRWAQENRDERQLVVYGGDGPCMALIGDSAHVRVWTFSIHRGENDSLLIQKRQYPTTEGGTHEMFIFV